MRKCTSARNEDGALGKRFACICVGSDSRSSARLRGGKSRLRISGFLLAGRHRFLLPRTKENGGAFRAIFMAHQRSYLIFSSFAISFRLMVRILLTPCSCMTSSQAADHSRPPVATSRSLRCSSFSHRNHFVGFRREP